VCLFRFSILCVFLLWLRLRLFCSYVVCFCLVLYQLPSVLCHFWLGSRKGIQSIKKYGGGRWRWALLSPDGVAPSRMVSVSTSVNLPLHHKVQKFSSGTGSPGWSRKRAVNGCGVVWYAKKLAGKNVSGMTYFVSSGT